jgi:FkbM family methyltransferase
MVRSAALRNLRLAWRSMPNALRPRILTKVSAALSGFRSGITNVPTLLNHVRANGFSPETIIDVGAFVGDWSTCARRVYPHARCIMIDANEDNRAQLAEAVQRIRNAEYEIALLGPEDRGVVFHVQSTGSSVLPELTPFERTERRVRMTRLDDLLSGREMPGPVLLKLDVQGFELEVLRGASRTLADSEVVILETSLLPYNEGAPLFSDVIGFMERAGFLAYDFCGQARRESDNTLFQTDVVFTKAASNLRAPRPFWLHEARHAGAAHS